MLSNFFHSALSFLMFSPKQFYLTTQFEGCFLSGLCFHTSCFVGCLSAVIIKMKNNVKEEHGSCAGKYERSFDVNGRPSYKKDDNAIWYIFGLWKIGPIDKLGSHTAYISAKDRLNTYLKLTKK